VIQIFFGVMSTTILKSLHAKIESYQAVLEEIWRWLENESTKHHIRSSMNHWHGEQESINTWHIMRK
jgi:hypothetical protein